MYIEADKINKAYILLYREIGYKAVMIEGFNDLFSLIKYINEHKNIIEVYRVLVDAK